MTLACVEEALTSTERLMVPCAFHFLRKSASPRPFPPFVYWQCWDVVRTWFGSGKDNKEGSVFRPKGCAMSGDISSFRPPFGEVNEAEVKKLETNSHVVQASKGESVRLADNRAAGCKTLYAILIVVAVVVVVLAVLLLS
jgi:hypothetical protein